VSEPADRLYQLLPAVHRQRDVEEGFTLRALLGIIGEQMDLLADDVAQLYDDWFIETCRDWVVPYIGELVGYQPVYEAGEPGDPATASGRLRNRILFPRRDVAHTIASRRRRGTLSVLIRQALDVAGWPARAVEFFTLLDLFQSLDHVQLGRGRLVDVREGDAFEELGGPFEAIAHTVDIRTLTSLRSASRYNIPNVGLFVWRLRSQSVTLRQPYCQEEVGRQFYTFSALGNDAPLFNRPEPPDPGTAVTDELQVPGPIRRRALERRLRDFYGEGKSLQIWWVPPGTPAPPRGGAPAARVMIPPERIVVADLTDWQYRTPDGRVAVDPVLGRIAFSPKGTELPRRGIWVSYHQGVVADLGGGEYRRALSLPAADTRIYRVGEGERYRRIGDALDQWGRDAPRRAFVEITDSAVYSEQVQVDLADGQGLELRAASRAAPVIRLLDWQTDQPDSISITGGPGRCVVLDGLMVAGRGMRVAGERDRLVIQHCTLVPGWALQPDCEPRRPAEPSLELDNVDAHVTIEHSIVGSIQVGHDEVNRDPIRIELHDSVLDATAHDREALGAPGWPFAHVMLTVTRSTVFGRIDAHAIALGENSIFHGLVRVARRQLGCLRFCYVTPGSRTPRRFRCQPDLAFAAVDEQYQRGELTPAERDAARRREELRVEPEYASTRYGTPSYCDLAATSAKEIRRGADDESAMGVFHDLFQPQREANLRGRLREFVPAGVQAAIIFVT